MVVEITELKKDTESKHEVKPENKAVSDAITENKKDTSSLHTIGSDASKPFADIGEIKKGTGSLHTLKADNSAPSAAISYNQQPTSSWHTIYVQTIQTNQNGGEIQYFANGGMPQFNFQRREGGLGGYGGGDTVPAMLEPGEWIIKKESVKKYGNGFMAKLNQGTIDEKALPKYQNGGAIGSSVGVQHFATGGGVNRKTLKRDDPEWHFSDAFNELDDFKAENHTKFEVSNFTQTWLSQNSISDSGSSSSIASSTSKADRDAADKENKSRLDKEVADKKASEDKRLADLKMANATAVADAKQAAENEATENKRATDQISADVKKAIEEIKQQEQKYNSEIETAEMQRLQLAGDKVGIENALWAKEEQALAGNAAALSIARENHNTRLKNIEDADTADAKSKLDKRVADAKAESDKRVADDKAAKETYKNQLDAATNEKLQLAGDKVGLEKAAFAKEEQALAGNAAALSIARENHNSRLKNIADADAADAKAKLDKQTSDAKAAQDKIESDTKAANDKLISDAKAARETYKSQLESATNEKLQLAGDKVGLEKAAFAREETSLAGNAAALKIARENHNTRLKNIADADAADAKAKLDKQTSDAKAAQDKAQQDAEKRQSQIDSLKDEVDGENGDKSAIENRRYQKQQKELAGNSEALALAQKSHAKKQATINAEKQKERQAEQAQSNAKNTPLSSSNTAANDTNSSQQTTQNSQNSNVVTIKFESPTGRQASGSFARADVTSVIDILKEAAARGLPPSLN